MKFLNFCTVFLIVLYSSTVCAQIPLYYTFKQINGTVFDVHGSPIHIHIKSRSKLKITNCQSDEMDTFFRTLILARDGRDALEHLLTTSSKVTIHISDKVGVLLKDGYYRIIAGLAGPERGQSRELIKNEVSTTLSRQMNKREKFVYVYAENTIELFTGVLNYTSKRGKNLKAGDIHLFDWKANSEIIAFSMDTICIEPLLYPKMLYKNKTELFYFSGIHEIYHTRPENIELQDSFQESESSAIAIEHKAFRHRDIINKKKIRK